MTLRQIASHDFRILLMRRPVAGEAVEAVLEDAKRHHPRLFVQMIAALKEYTPVNGPPYAEERYGVVRAKRLDVGVSEFIALNQEVSRRKRAKQPQEEKMLGLRVFFFQYGYNIICTNACYKTSPTPPDAIPAALRVQQAYLNLIAKGSVPTILEGD